TETWVELDCVVDAENHTITASVSHFTDFAIIGKVAPLPAALAVSDLSVQPGEVEAGEAVTVTVSVANTGGVEGTYNLVLKVNGAAEATEDISVAGGASESAIFTLSREEPGDYTVSVNGLEGSFTVMPPAPAPVPPPPPAAAPPAPQPAPAPAERPVNWGLIAGVVVGLAVVGSVIFFLVRRRAT
ncbi:MAG: CARDB domain-containing protein, partial [Dehalococcoidales bacterium]